MLDGLLCGISRDAFEAIFSLDHDTLVDGGKALLDADGELGESLFGASMGATALHELRCTLQEQADGLFRPRASSTEIVRVRAVYDAKATEINARTLRANAFKSSEREAERVAGKITKLRGVIATLRARNAARERLCMVHPLLIRRRVLLDEPRNAWGRSHPGCGCREVPRVGADNRADTDRARLQRRAAGGEAG